MSLWWKLYKYALSVVWWVEDPCEMPKRNPLWRLVRCLFRQGLNYQFFKTLNLASFIGIKATPTCFFKIRPSDSVWRIHWELPDYTEQFENYWSEDPIWWSILLSLGIEFIMISFKFAVTSGIRKKKPQWYFWTGHCSFLFISHPLIVFLKFLSRVNIVATMSETLESPLDSKEISQLIIKEINPE